MEGISLCEIAAAHPETDVYRIEGVCYAWKQTADGGELTYGRTEEELAAKLDAG